MRRDFYQYFQTARGVVDDLENTLRAEDKKEDGFDTGDLWAYHTHLVDALDSMGDCIEEALAAIGTT